MIEEMLRWQREGEITMPAFRRGGGAGTKKRIKATGKACPMPLWRFRQAAIVKAAVKMISQRWAGRCCTLRRQTSEDYD